MEKTSNGSPSVSVRKVRVGILLWVISFIPFPLAILAVLHAQGYLSSAKSSSTFIAVTWGLQYLIGFAGLFFAGKEAITVAKEGGYRKLPMNIWRLVIHGETSTASSGTVAP